MKKIKIGLAQTEEEIFAFEVSDEALEIAAGSTKEKANFTLGAWPSRGENTLAAVFKLCRDASTISDQQITTNENGHLGREKSVATAVFTALLSLLPTAVAMAVAPPTVTMMAMVIVTVVVNRRTKIVPGSGFADWRHRSGDSAKHWS